MDIKTFVQSKTVGAVNRHEGEFPSREVLEKEVFPAFMMPNLPKTLILEEFLSMVKANPDLAAVRVHKQASALW